MTTDANAGETPVLSPEDAFSVLGDETRLQILQTLAAADEPLPFSEVFDRVDYDDPPNFNYHLKKLTGHFVEKTDDVPESSDPASCGRGTRSGYAIRQPGLRVVESVLSGAVTEAPSIERTAIDRPCQHCGASSVEVDYRAEQVGVYCTECRGQYGGESEGSGEELPSERERIGHVYLPPAGVRGRSATEVVEAAFVWTTTQAQALHRGVCPRCSAAVDDSVSACEDHDASDDLCGECDRRFAITVDSRCTNCPFGLDGSAIGYLHTDPDLLTFLAEHGFDPLSSPFPSTLDVAAFEEELLDTDPFAVRFTFDIDGDTLALTLDDDLDVVDATRSRSSEST